jgi:hypothetical protein
LVQCPRSRPDLAMFLVTRSGADQPGPGMGEALEGQRIFAVRGARVFHGRRWQNETYPKVKAFIRAQG